MPITSTMVGALLGLGTQMYSNALRKLPYMRHPWEHVLGMGLGAVFVNQLVKWDEQLKVDLDKMLDKAKAANERRYIDNFDIPNQEIQVLAIQGYLISERDAKTLRKAGALCTGYDLALLTFVLR
ncbi:hypothetical protein DVH24_022020 [Malus domestica]|uniref:Uncharacterized protein n=1 Tax=Malus domestica TaxID=3750 RepID=A0A498IWT3_MALDO|nr:hypothetical protein DVH24_022020 [Malus domestica]